MQIPRQRGKILLSKARFAETGAPLEKQLTFREACGNVAGAMNWHLIITWFSRRIRALRWLLLFIVALYVAETIDILVFGQDLNYWGVEPRQTDSLARIPLMPLLHDGYGHLVGNTGPLLILGGMTVLYGAGTFVATTAFCALASGLGIWLLAAPGTVHIGASGLVYGYFGFLIARALFDHSFFSMLLAGAVLIAYGSLVLMLSPLQQQISWEGHIFGLLGGFLSAAVLTPSTLRDPDQRAQIPPGDSAPPELPAAVSRRSPKTPKKPAKRRASRTSRSGAKSGSKKSATGKSSTTAKKARTSSGSSKSAAKPRKSAGRRK